MAWRACVCNALKTIESVPARDTASPARTLEILVNLNFAHTDNSAHAFHWRTQTRLTSHLQRKL